MSQCYIVQGSSGEYADYVEWPVRVFLDKGKAEAFREELQAWLRENVEGLRGGLRNERDPEGSYDVETLYKVVPTPFES